MSISCFIRYTITKVLNTLAIFPTLDGRVVIVELNNYKIIQNIILNTQNFLNNTFFLEIKGDYLIASTSYKILVIGPKNFKEKNLNIKKVLIYDNKIYIFQKDGTISSYDFNLNKITSKKLPFAVYSFVGTLNGKIIAIEKNGYLVTLDYGLNNLKVYKLPSKVKKHPFLYKNKLNFWR